MPDIVGHGLGGGRINRDALVVDRVKRRLILVDSTELSRVVSAAMISVFTPLTKTGNPYIEAAWETLKAQTFPDWEWIVLENHGGSLPKQIRKDPRVKVFGDAKLEGIGAIKRRCCELSSPDAEFLLEFDHDDLLHEQALEKAMAAFAEGADFVFSDTAEFRVVMVPVLDGQGKPVLDAQKNPKLRVLLDDQGKEIWEPNVYSPEFGWSSYEVEFKGHQLLAQPNPPVTPHNLRLIDWAPNHFRAFRKDAYWGVGGHNPELPVADDHELMLKLFLGGKKFHHVEECLYFYRVHDKQTTNGNVGNSQIRALTEQLYGKYIFELAEKFCESNLCPSPERMIPLRKIDLCGAIDTYVDYEPLDKSLGHDLDERWPLEDNSVGVIRAYDAIEHLKNPIHTMNEAYRVLAPGGLFLILVPSTDGRGAFQDPTHVSFWNQNSFWYYTKRSHARYVPGLQARFQVARLHSFFPNNFCRENSIPYVEAHLIALKDGYQPM